ncbi:MAG: hypothetical protein KDI06_01065, partial [Calditrichaeota bacterium]|nr:hypothetical protein [Calditrichota bacterium]
MLKFAAAITLALAALCLSACSEEPVNPRDKTLFLRAKDLAAYGLAVDTTREYFAKSVRFDGSVRLVYQYQAPGGREGLETYYFLKGDSAKARISYHSQLPATLGMLEQDYLFNRPDSAFPQLGSESGMYDLFDGEGNPRGHFFMMHGGKMVCLLTIKGLVLDDKKALADLIR